MDLINLGTLTVKGMAPCGIGGVIFNYKPRTMRFKITNKGFVRNKLLYPTFDPEIIIKTFGLSDATYTTKYNVEVR